MTQNNTKLAHIILSAADIREGSWDDDKHIYHISYSTATVMANDDVASKETKLATILLANAWNDALEWATSCFQ